MRHHNSNLNQNFLKITKKVGDAQVQIFKDENSSFEGAIAVSHPSAYPHASNISRIIVGQFVFLLRVEKEGLKFTFKLERYDLDQEVKDELVSHTVELPDKMSADVVKFIQKRKFKAPIRW